MSGETATPAAVAARVSGVEKVVRTAPLDQEIAADAVAICTGITLTTQVMGDD